MWGEDFVPVSIRIPGCINVFPLYKVTKSMIQYPFENNFCFTCRSLLVVSIPYPWLISLICLMQMTFLSFQYIRTKCIAFEICITEHHHHHRLNTVFLKGFLSYSSLGFIIRWGFFLFFFYLRDVWIGRCTDVINVIGTVRNHKNMLEQLILSSPWIKFHPSRSVSMWVGHKLANNWSWCMGSD